MISKKIIAILAVAVIAVAAAAVMVTATNDDSNKEDEPSNYVTFYIYDSYKYEYGSTTGMLKTGNHLADGFWVKGYGDTKKDCFVDACEKADIPLVMNGYGIFSINGISDGNFSQCGYYRGNWTADIWLGSEEDYKVRYMCIGHGAWSGGTDAPPLPKTSVTPDNILWCYGDNTVELGSGNMKIAFYFYDNYENDAAGVSIATYPTDVSKFAADGYCVYGCGNTISEAFSNACERAYGDGVAIVYNDETGVINRIGEVVNYISAQSWNGSAWVSCNMSELSYSDGMYIAIGHGYSSSGGTPPTPWEVPENIDWIL